MKSAGYAVRWAGPPLRSGGHLGHHHYCAQTGRAGASREGWEGPGRQVAQMWISHQFASAARNKVCVTGNTEGSLCSLLSSPTPRLLGGRWAPPELQQLQRFPHPCELPQLALPALNAHYLGIPARSSPSENPEASEASGYSVTVNSYGACCGPGLCQTFNGDKSVLSSNSIC